jgi:hypothetical protein
VAALEISREVSFRPDSPSLNSAFLLGLFLVFETYLKAAFNMILK